MVDVSVGWVLIVGLTAARVWWLFAEDSLLAGFRFWLHGRSPRVFGWVECPWCSGFWLSAGLGLTVWWGEPFFLVGVGVFAASFVCSLAAGSAKRLFGGDD